LKRRGVEVHVAATGRDGLAALEAGAFDVVALDHYMPGQDGLEVLTLIRARPDPPPVVFVTGASESRIAVAALKAGAVDYVVKEIGGAFIELLEAAIRSALAGVQLRRAKAAADREIRAARDRFEALAAERQVLLREVNHRVGNSLQLVAAFLHLQSSTAVTPETRTALAEANRRVLAIAQVHRRLFASEDVSQVPLGAYLAGLVDDLRQSSDADGIGDCLSLETVEVMIDADSAVTIGIIVTELVINAMKYAYPQGRGPIRVRLTGPEALPPSPAAPGPADSGRHYRLAVEDEGVGKGETGKGETGKGEIGEATSAGLGRSIIKAMAAKLAGEVLYEACEPGTRAHMLFRLPMETGAGAGGPAHQQVALSRSALPLP
jgi:two-component sensor histidine kinase